MMVKGKEAVEGMAETAENEKQKSTFPQRQIEMDLDI